ncbi:polysaccharide biosynthesis tyrosine autokinase [Variovorax sp. RTB1]|uniref:polysaccharide biosynthesis tyrosine autokinase n=1 Tax=Variovorax sp. RTB1 TaxID=3048631 RepID=UPI002B235BC8|nr:polysaccharide biosynthesis tyrosine autokinase [Variovorax sp. RTB1]MEB0112521.1 polysaccharide biosynthesis tyrosine autokinase [Variovorax sp. RTB1]
MLVDAEEAPRLSAYKDILLDHKWLIACIVALTLLIGLAYVTLATPVYRANLLVQVEDSAPDSKSFLNETTGMFEVKTPVSGEIQVLGSRMVLNAAAEQAGLQTSAQPRYLPLVGPWLARRAVGFSDPLLGGYVSGTERIDVTRFNVPPSLEDTGPFIITTLGGGRYRVSHELLDVPLEGVVGQPLQQTLSEGVVDIQLSQLSGKPGAQFNVYAASLDRAVDALQGRLQMVEQGRQSNVIGVTLEDSNRVRLAAVLNAIAEQYLRQNMERKSAEAEKTITFLNTQLPIFERQLRASEDAYAHFRNENGTVAFDEEAKVWLAKTATLQTSLLDLQQKRRETEPYFTDQSSRVLTLDKQIGAVQGELGALNSRIAGMPNVQRDALRLERDVRVNGALYQSMQSNVLQMRLLKEGKTGNVRLVDKAAVSKVPVKPQKLIVLALALVLGLMAGPALAIWRSRSRPGVHNPEEIEVHTGLDVYAVVPHSPEQLLIDRGTGRKKSSGTLLADVSPHSHPIEALRELRVGLKIAMAEASNNRILVTGATPGIGKSFIARNFAMLLAQSGKRVLLINADLRKRDLSGTFSLQHEGGLSELLTGKLSAQQAIHVQVHPNLDVLTTGKLPRLPADMLESAAFTVALDELSSRYDSVVIDSAPVLVAADAAAVAPACGLVLLVARAGKSQLGELNESVRRLAKAGVKIDGVLFNGMDFSRRYNGNQGYRHGGYKYSEYEYAAKAA